RPGRRGAGAPGQEARMPTYMVQAAYTSTAWGKLVQRPANRLGAVRPVIEKLRGPLHAWYYCWGDYDVVMFFDVPDNVNAAAVSMAVAAGGAVKEIKTTPLMQPDEGFDAMLLAQGAGYRPPGGCARGAALGAAPAVLAGFLGAGVAAVGLGLGVALGARHVEHALVRAG